jgi:hypothetical protein
MRFLPINAIGVILHCLLELLLSVGSSAIIEERKLRPGLNLHIAHTASLIIFLDSIYFPPKLYKLDYAKTYKGKILLYDHKQIS